ncbi:MAG TPA: hypothetical protein VFW29_12295 [Solirubrobacteraceae bacterium]|nr:hypothetical protein [Solirubrobacteraceae bacterium]
MSSILPAIVACAALALCAWRLQILHPVTLWSASWAASTLLYALRLLPYRDLGWLTTLLICGSIAVFAAAVPLGARLAGKLARTRPGPPPQAGLRTPDDRRVEVAAALAIGLLAVTLAAFLARLIAKFGVSHALRISAEVKVYLSSNEAPASGIYVEFAIAAAALCGLAWARARTRRGRRGWLVAALACAASVYFSTSRGFIAVALASALVAAALGRGAMPRRRMIASALAAGVVVVALFVGLGAVIGKTYGNSSIGQFDNFFSRHHAASSLALPYQDATASIPALDLLVRYSPTFGVAHGCATAPIVCGALRKLGLHVVRVPVAGQFTALPLQWNAYTFLDRFLIDWGPALTLVLVAITGLIAGFVWALARARSTVGILLYATCAPALVAAYRQNLIELVALAAGLAIVALLAGGRLARSEPIASRLSAMRSATRAL